MAKSLAALDLNPPTQSRSSETDSGFWKEAWAVIAAVAYMGWFIFLALVSALKQRLFPKRDPHPLNYRFRNWRC